MHKVHVTSAHCPLSMKWPWLGTTAVFSVSSEEANDMLGIVVLCTELQMLLRLHKSLLRSDDIQRCQ